ncbi:MAG TPA: 2-amino-4-hydroxy-6-hydroxymethyldihydropteridine diphosphokinase [Deltaproteobacteria bacterium]|nr:2-amino-4-hydroxy-6-hydroxymethyldihydropteridine diphosphokinase [Deltaproteobacteria bacterium]
MTEKAYIGVGSNLGDKVANCQAAVEKVDSLPGCSVRARSGLYRTEPVDVEDQDWYVNGVIRVDTDLPARGLLMELLAIEASMGRVRKQKWEARIIDLDILLYGNHRIKEEDLIIPHPLMHSRRFVLVPLNQLDPDLVHPVSGRAIWQLLRACGETGQDILPLGA